MTEKHTTGGGASDVSNAAAGPLKAVLLEEVASLSTRDVVTGRVRVSTTVEEIQDVARASLQSEAVDVTRVKIDRPIDSFPMIRTEGEITIIPIIEEVLVVEKRLVLKEELHLRKTVSTRTFEEPVTLRRQKGTIERLDEDGNPRPID